VHWDKVTMTKTNMCAV